MIRNLNEDDMQLLVETMQADNNPNAAFAKGAHNLWIRFKNYKNNPPFVNFTSDYHVGAVCMITKLKREPYANLYEIFAVYPGHATRLYWDIMAHMKANGVERLKMSCTPSSIGWHYRNGIVGWAVDPSGSIRVDVPICETQADQLALRNGAIHRPELVMPPAKQQIKLAEEENSFGPKKIIQVEKAIETMGEFYMRRHLIN